MDVDEDEVYLVCSCMQQKKLKEDISDTTNVFFL
jgi:hypothetical protein